MQFHEKSNDVHLQSIKQEKKFNNAIHKYFIHVHLHNLDRIFDTSNSTQDVYDEFGKPTVQSAMDGFNGKMK